MGSNSTVAAIETRMARLWGHPEPVAYEGVPFSPPSDRGPWVRITVREGDGLQATIAGDQSKVRVVGMIFVDAFVSVTPRVGSTTQINAAREAEALADRAVPIFEAAQFNGIFTGARKHRPFGPDDAGWYQYQIGFPYYRDETIRTSN